MYILVKIKERKIIELSPKEIKINLEKIQKEVMNVNKMMKNMLPEVVKETEIKPFGNASHIILPKEYKGKKAIIIIKK